MIAYSKFAPTCSDTRGLGLIDRQEWLVCPVGQNRDSGPLATSNYRVVLKDLQSIDAAGADHEEHRFGHWACGWFEIVLVRPGSACAKSAEDWEGALSDYPVACDGDFYQLEHEVACETWANCYSNESRLEYIRENWSEFEFQSFADLLGCVRGTYFAGDASRMAGDS